MLMMNHFYTGPIMVNTYVVYDEEQKEAFIVDPGGKSPEMESFIESKKLTVKFIILTHGHGDHIGGVEEYRQKYNAPVYAHFKEKEMLASPDYNSSRYMLQQPISIEADKWLNDNDEIPFCGDSLKIIHTPGHSPGGICILLPKTKWLFSGDTLFRGSIGRTDFPLCSTADLFDSIRSRLFVLDPEIEVFPGHEGFTTIGMEQMYNPFF